VQGRSLKFIEAPYRGSTAKVIVGSETTDGFLYGRLGSGSAGRGGLGSPGLQKPGSCFLDIWRDCGGGRLNRKSSPNRGAAAENQTHFHHGGIVLVGDHHESHTVWVDSRSCMSISSSCRGSRDLAQARQRIEERVRQSGQSRASLGPLTR
jgi:hypothetical protein